MKDASLILTIGDISVQVISGDQSFLKSLVSYYPHFINQGSPHIEARITLNHQTLQFREDIVVTNDNDLTTIDGGEFKGIYCKQTKEAHFTMRAEASLFDSFLRVFYSIILVEHDGFLVHAAGLRKGNEAYLFAGPSESGKTTTATMADGFTVLNDELVLVKKKEGAFHLHATPFNGNYDRPIQNSSASLSGFFFLDKHLGSPFEPVEKIVAMTGLLETVFFFDPDIKANQRILDLCQQMVSQYDAFKINIRSRQCLEDLIYDAKKEYCYT